MSGARTRPFWSAVWLAIVLVLIKGSYLGAPHGLTIDGARDYVRSLAAISYRDVACATVLWACARLGPRRLETAWPAVCALLAAYAAANVALFSALGGPLTYPLLLAAIRTPLLQEAIGNRLTPRLLVLLVSLVVAFVAIVELTVRLSRVVAGRRRSAVAMLAVAGLAWSIEGRATFITRWHSKQDWRIAENSHAVFLWSWLKKAAGERMVWVPERIDPADFADFEPLGVRRRSPPARAAEAPMNVILLVLESVGARWAGLNGGLYDTTPTLKRESAHALVFDNVYAHIGRSSNALVAMLFSAYPKLDFRDITAEYPRLPRTALASIFHDRGYRTGFMTSSDLGWAGWNTFLQGRGFETVRDYRSLMCSQLLSEWGVEDRCLVDATIQFIGQEPGRPFFLMDWTTQTHYPYEPTPGVDLLDLAREPGPDQWDLGRYLNVLHETDRHLARLFDALRRASLDRNTLVVVTGDHGQAFGYPHDSYGQGQTAYEEDLHIPLMLWSPRLYDGAPRSSTIGGQIDIAPTIAELTGIVPGDDWQGRDLLANDHPPRVYFYVAEDRFILGVRENNWKYLFDLRAGIDELYNLDRDPNEQHSVATEEPGRAERLRQRLAAWMEANRRTFSNTVSAGRE